MTDNRSSRGSASAREKVAAFLLARDENYAATPHMLAWAEKLIRDCKDAEHDGDCTNKSHTCHRCTADQALDDADKIIALTPIGVAQGSQQPAGWLWQAKSTGDREVWFFSTVKIGDREGLYIQKPLYAVPPSPAGEWQPIETAPEDRTTVIVWDDPVMGEAYFDTDEKSWWWANTGSGDYTASAIYPTLWRPMPAPPIPSPPETTRNLAESICDDCPPAGSIEGTRCLVCPRTSPMPSTHRERGNRFCKREACAYPDCLVEGGVCPSQPPAHREDGAQ